MTTEMGDGKEGQMEVLIQVRCNHHFTIQSGLKLFFSPLFLGTVLDGSKDLPCGRVSNSFALD